MTLGYTSHTHFASALRAAEHACLDRRLAFGSVSRQGQAAHTDMDAALMKESLEAIIKGLPLLPSLPSSLGPLRTAGQSIEQAMFQASKGVNTHKGLLFLLAFLYPALRDPRLDTLKEAMREGAIQAQIQALSLGLEEDYAQGMAKVHKAFGLKDIRVLVQNGLAPLFALAKEGLSDTRLSLALIAHLDDGTTFKYGGLEGLRMAQAKATAILKQRSLNEVALEAEASALNAWYEAQRLRSGGVADCFTLVRLLEWL